jgi:hypothetical protein
MKADRHGLYEDSEGNVKLQNGAFTADKGVSAFGEKPLAAQPAHIADIAADASGALIAGAVNAIIAVLENAGLTAKS